ncbi:MAG TPA: ATP-binding cassette domain-containing protein [Steroidobacteraceae bacterium]|jgi:lipooligosaccharide transport system ATP-binding protein|nr:ATP-binding cassette domain-containing protein [Steroidobacteraceae bacterium]
MHALTVELLRKSYGAQEVVKGISFNVAAGECFGLLGPNGAGKTTTLRCCLGHVEPDSGAIRLSELEIPRDARAARARVGVVTQFDNLDVHFTVAENLVVYGRYFGLRERECRALVPRLLEFAGLTEKGDAKIETLSGGMKRRLMIARSLVNDPEVLFLDEPTTGLDPQARHLIWDRLKSFVAGGRTIVLTTHFMDEVQRLCDRVAIIDRGALVAIDSPAAMITREIESVVIEVHGASMPQWVERHGRPVAARIEIAGDTAFCYCRDPQPLLRTLDATRSLRAVQRDANLEDVFLKLTGRDLRD